MADTPELLPKSREYFRKFIAENKEDFYNIMLECRVGHGTGYSYFYRSDDVIQCVRDIYHNIDETFGNLTIPEEFPSPKRLVKTWKWFYDYLVEKNVVFKEIEKYFIDKAESEQGVDIKEIIESGAFIYPLPFTYAASMLGKTKDLLEYILEMDEVEIYLNQITQSQNVTIENKKAKEAQFHAEGSEFDIAVLTAIYEPEFRRVKEILTTPQSFVVPGDPTRYTKGNIVTTGGRSVSVIVASDDKMGMPATATLATKMILSFKPKYLIMLGICAGVNGKVEEGDVIITEYAWDYGSGKHELVKDFWGVKREIFKPYINQIQLDVSLEMILKQVVSDKKYVADIQTQWNSNHVPMVNVLTAHIGPFASGSAVIANERIVKEINTNHGKLQGFDMEAYAVFHSARHTPPCTTKPIVMKSVSDFGDSNKNRPNKDILQDYAAYTSAQFFLRVAQNDLEY